MFGFYGLFVLKQADIKQGMTLNINGASSTEKSETLSFDKAEFAKLVFTDGGKEFSYEGRLYDVVEIKNSGSRVTVVVEYDAKETDLVETFASLFSQQQGKDQNSSPVKNIISHFQQDYVITNSQTLSADSNSASAHCCVNPSYPPSSFVADQLAPPPQFFLV